VSWLKTQGKKHSDSPICSVVEDGHNSTVGTRSWVLTTLTIQEIIMKQSIDHCRPRAVGDVSSISDTEFLEEYKKRFTISSGESIGSAKEAANHFRSFFSDASKKERFVVCYLNGQHQVLSTEALFEGSLTTSAVYSREVITRVIETAAAAIVVAHNHPSGLTTPSSSDRAVTKKLQTALASIDVDLLDHIILAGADYLSFADSRLM